MPKAVRLPRAARGDSAHVRQGVEESGWRTCVKSGSLAPKDCVSYAVKLLRYCVSCCNCCDAGCVARMFAPWVYGPACAGPPDIPAAVRTALPQLFTQLRTYQERLSWSPALPRPPVTTVWCGPLMGFGQEAAQHDRDALTLLVGRPSGYHDKPEL